MAIAFRSFLLLLATLGATAAQAQTPTLEFAPGAGNSTASGPTAANQLVTFQNNTTNPTSNTMTAYSPAVTTTFALSNQQFTLPTSRIANGAGVAFGAGLSTTSGTAPAFALLPLLNAVGGSSNANYTSASGVAGGIDVAANSGAEVFTSIEPLPATLPANTARYQYADLTLTFNRAVVNPVVHLTGLGGSFTTGGVKTGYTTELDLLTKGLTLSELSGSTELTVNSTQILNNAAQPDGTTGSGAASGSVLVTTPSQGITTLVFRLYLRPAASGGTIHGDNATTHLGDGWLISVSTRTATTANTAASIAPLPVRLVEFTAQAAPGGRSAQLAWATATEVNNAYFEVERSFDGATYAPLGRVAGQGMKATTTTYAFVDEQGLGAQPAGLVYYRLRQVDLDGTATYSPVRPVRLGVANAAGAASLSLYPNPAQASTTLDLSALPATASYQVLVLDATGRQVQRMLLAGGQPQRLDLSSVVPGLFTVLVTGPQADGTPLRQALRLHKE
ncbi:T9SS type A sorting domain-containing protein [Hymenobacter sp. BT559]|uniref:T9SS type A sorting domain-containing protein n=1 Tax=Hymenobacter sp. BT559 TaxID=2795729 RepID=UPI0018EC69AE|nr:T9SS type A sorting domain-containing protein [Hymenobacter sp. BT559]MBJ6145259.1 T9SS type A sorting domain-containing protein [Hymenobacter sp. BT559]